MAVPVNASIVKHCQMLEDPRIEWTKKHPLLAILVIAWCTLLTSGEGFQDMEFLGKSKQAWLQIFLTLPHESPSHDTFVPGVCPSQAPAFSGVLAVLDPGSRAAYPRRPHLAGWENRQSVL